MKKLLSMLTIGTLVSTNIPNINIVLNTNLNKKYNINSMKNLKSDPIVNWIKLGKKSAFANKINDNLFVLVGQAAHLDKDYLVDKNGTIVKELKMDNKNVNGGGFTRFNDNNIFFSGNSYFTSSYMMDLNGDFVDLGKRGIFCHFNDKIGVFREIVNNRSYFLNAFGQFTEIKKDGQSIISQFLRFSDDLSVMVGNESWLMDSNGIFLKKLDKEIISLIPLNSRKAIVNVRINSEYESWLMDSNGVFIKDLGKGKYKGFTRLNDNLGLFVDNLNESWLMDSNGDFIKKLDKKGTFTRLNDNLGVFVDNLNESWLMNSNGDFIKKLDKKGSNFTFTRLNDNLGVFVDNLNESWFLSITPNPDDIAGLKSSVHFEPKKQSQIITDINTSKYQGKGSNGDINFNVENENITEVKIDNEIQSITDHKVQKTITSEGQHEIVITNTLTTPLKYNLYIKKELLKDDIIPTSSSTKHSNYVGIIPKQNLANTKMPNLIDVLQYSAEIKFDYNDFLLDSNKYYTLDKDFKLINPIDVFKDTKISVSGNYLIQASDLIHNTWQQYLTIGTPTITDFRSTNQWKQAENWALKNGYKQSDLDRMNANEIKDLLSKYNPSPTPSPTPNPNNNIGWYIFLGVFLGLITFGIVGFYINKFVIKPIRNKRSDIKADKYVAEQMELSKKWKEQEEKEKQTRDKNKGGK